MGLVIGDKVLGGAVINNKVVGGMVTENKVIFRSSGITDSAGRVNIRSISSINEFQPVALRYDLSGAYDTACTPVWTVVTGSGTIDTSEDPPIFTPASADAGNNVTVRVSVAFTGTGTNANAGTSNTDTDDETFAVEEIGDFVRFPNDEYDAFGYDNSRADLVAFKASTNTIIRRSRNGVDEGTVTITGLPAGATVTDISYDSAGGIHLWDASGTTAKVFRCSSSGAYQSTVTMSTAGGSKFGHDFQSNRYYSLDGSTLRTWASSGSQITAHLLTGVTEQDVIVDFVADHASDVWLVSDGRAVTLSTGAIATGLSGSWPNPGTGNSWESGFEDPAVGGSIWLFRNEDDDAIAYRVGSGAAVPAAFGTHRLRVPANHDVVGTIGHYRAGQGNMGGYRTTILQLEAGETAIGNEIVAATLTTTNWPDGRRLEQVRGRQSTSSDGTVVGTSDPLRRFQLTYEDDAANLYRSEYGLTIGTHELIMQDDEGNFINFGTPHALASWGIRWRDNDSADGLGTAMRDWINGVFTNQREFLIAWIAPSS